MKLNLGNLPPDMTEPPPDARGWIAFQPTTGKVRRKVDGEWLRIEEALARIEARTLTH
ncbi:hypothetical protein QIH85_43015 [Bradyrhizobium japonicum]|uniref:hypothetical protein n=1 Tax=Bradyrhizobium japonicum TaxID=375 RepID=UPI001E4517F5|nr:hypothetical protein [Bradyrhizobium japonicum]MCD9898135.1 hypothetical protein [Bradyrhizobium japonicum]WLB28504.1 hypothetical protein QIH85_43015 [Bradyrhizobium japonicum]WRJ84742.1 hypothetical protein R3F78_07640 [Bradyrhizobium japonicum]WRJ93712.1 hypothetical protein R3F77_05350 [Bradyrhizobium japonicum]WRK47564.1 hypothetical protein R3F73_05410 [Bradyrhizobium japonicum]